MVRSMKTRCLAKYGVRFLLLLIYARGAAAQAHESVHLTDNSDWWSIVAYDFDAEVPSENREFADTNFTVLGIGLNEGVFERAAGKLGKAKIVERGDAASARQQVCYVSAGPQERTHLIFEKGEIGLFFYLFADGAAWKGSNRCVASKMISRAAATESGLRLGQTPAQVIAILGKPTKQSEDTLIYSFSIRKKASEQDVKQAHRQHPDMSDKELHESFDFYDLTAEIHAKFARSRLIYLAVSKVETN
jgi:hypothetical protein